MTKQEALELIEDVLSTADGNSRLWEAIRIAAEALKDQIRSDCSGGSCEIHYEE